MCTREYAAALFRRTLARVDIRDRIRAQVTCDPQRLHISEFAYDLPSYQRLIFIAVGKAALSMTSAFEEILSPCLRPDQPLEGVVVSALIPDKQHVNFRYFAAGHPLPDASSRAAAEHTLDLLRGSGQQDLVLFLISGGASAMLEKALWDDISIAETATFYSELVRSGLSITDMNCLRKHFSAVKGGRLAQAAASATQCTVLVSDVPEGPLNVIGSGPSMPDTSTVADCRRILQHNGLADRLPPAVLRSLSAADLPDTVKADCSAFARASFLCLLSNKDLLREAAALATADGFHTVIDNTCDDWHYDRAADYLLGRVEDLRRVHRRVCLLSGGEVAVRLPAVHGIGGRNQQFALLCALRVSGTTHRTVVLSAGSDGLDGNSPAAGAVVDDRTADELHEAAFSPETALARFDAYPGLNHVGAAVETGPTGTNLRDIRILLSEDTTL